MGYFMHESAGTMLNILKIIIIIVTFSEAIILSDGRLFYLT